MELAPRPGWTAPAWTPPSSRATASGSTPTALGSSRPRSRPTGAPGVRLTYSTSSPTVGPPSSSSRSPHQALPPGPTARRSGTITLRFSDTVAIERKGLAPLKPALDSIAALADRKALSRYLGTTLRADVDIFNATNLYTPNLLGLWVAQDLDDPSHYSAFLVQGGLGMPDRSYYLDSSPAITEVREQVPAPRRLQCSGSPAFRARTPKQRRSCSSRPEWPGCT